MISSTTFFTNTPLNDFAVQWTGQILITQGGQYSFQLTSNDNDGSRLFIDGQRVVNNDGLTNSLIDRSIGSIDLSPGYHDLRVDYFAHLANDTTFGTLELSYQPPGQTGFSFVPASVLRTGGLSDISGLIGLPKPCR